MALRGVLLDLDGTLVLSVDAHAAAWSQAFGEAALAVYDDPDHLLQAWDASPIGRRLRERG